MEEGAKITGGWVPVGRDVTTGDAEQARKRFYNSYQNIPHIKPHLTKVDPNSPEAQRWTALKRGVDAGEATSISLTMILIAGFCISYFLK